MTEQHPPEHSAAATELRLDLLLGRKVLTSSGRTAGRIEEFRTAVVSGERAIVEYVIGGAGLLERLNVGFRQILGLGRSGHVARWDQIDLSDPRRPRLRCAVDQLKRI
jgi:hypothetical protein